MERDERVPFALSYSIRDWVLTKTAPSCAFNMVQDFSTIPVKMRKDEYLGRYFFFFFFSKNVQWKPEQPGFPCKRKVPVELNFPID